MIDFLNVCKGYGGDPILDRASFRVNAGERIGIVGPNGAGKSTVFSLLSGGLQPDKGTINLPKNLRIGYLRQQLPASGKTALPLIDFTMDAIDEVRQMNEELQAIEQQLHAGDAAGADRDRLLIRQGELQSAVEQLGLYRLKPEAEAALCSLGFEPDALTRPLADFSGGWQMRAALARVLIAQPDLLMLDEPSNYLDVPAVEYLCRTLKAFKGTLLLISHDRFLLRKLTGVTLEVNNGVITRYAGDYDFYRQEREFRRKTLEAAKRNVDRKKEHLEKVIDRFRAKSSKAASAKSWQKVLDRIEDVVLPDELGFSGAIRFPAPPPCGTPVAEVEDVSFGYPGGPELLKKVSLRIENGDKIAFIGYNGTGKTTFLKLLVGSLKPADGRISYGHHLQLGYQAQEFSDLLVDEQSVYDTVRGALPPGASQADLMRILGSFGFSGDEVEKRCGVLSGGEKIRLCFARIFVNPPNLLVLDEPTTHLDVAARELLQKALIDYPGTVCFVSHDIEFVRGVANTIVAMEPGGIRKYYGNYDYFLEKSARNTVAAAPVKAAAPAVDSAKERRRERARKRAGIQGEKRRAEQRVAEWEKKIADSEARRDELAAQMSGGGKIDFEAVNRELAEVQQTIDRAMEEWEAAAWDLNEIIRRFEEESEE
ncbi:MAG: ABC-F family ATP-binding cassette domain-containing protein [Lentisphaeria bacterium]|nr:ABC-F family ATP-binding cassette domain-containing protein [Lentisphaeria bacterium]